MDIFPRDKKKIQQRIKNYESALRKEEREHGSIGDGYGKRYLLGPLYLLAEDTHGALKHYTWFEETFPDDSGDPWHRFCWAITLLRSGDHKGSVQKMYQAMFIDLFFLCFVVTSRIDEIPRFDGHDEYKAAQALDTPQDLIDILSKEEKLWLTKFWEHPMIVERRNSYLALEKKLKSVSPGPERNALLKTLYALRDSHWLPDVTY